MEADYSVGLVALFLFIIAFFLYLRFIQKIYNV